MNRIISIILIIFVGCISTENQSFKRFIGLEESEALDIAIMSFDSFIVKNFDSINTKRQRYLAYLQTLLDYRMVPNPSWSVDPVFAKSIINTFEISGLRLELWKYGYESYEDEETMEYYSSVIDTIFSSRNGENENLDPSDINDDFEEIFDIPPVENPQPVQTEPNIDSLIMPSPFSRIVVGLHKFAKNDEMVQGYCEAMISTHNNLSPYLLVDAFLSNAEKVDFDSYYIKTIIVTELYYYMLRDILNG